jgi:hypothetical protein
MMLMRLGEVGSFPSILMNFFSWAGARQRTIDIYQYINIPDTRYHTMVPGTWYSNINIVIIII